MKRYFHFKTKLIIANVAIALFIMFCLIFVFYNSTSKQMTERAMDDFDSLTQKTATQLESLLYDMDRAALQIAANPTIIQYFMEVDDNIERNYFSDNPLTAQNIIKVLNSYNFKEDSFSRICLYNNRRDFLYSGSVMTTNSAVEHFFDKPLYTNLEKTFDEDGTFFLYRMPQHDFFNDSSLYSPDIFSVVREIRDYEGINTSLGYIEVQYSVKYINEIFSDLSEQTYAFVLDHNENIVYHTLSNDDVMTSELEAELIHLIKDASSVDSTHNYFINTKSLNKAPLNVVFVKSKDAVLGPLLTFQLTLVIATIAMISVIIISTTLVISRLSKPLTQLQQSIKGINIENLHLQLHDVQHTDELEQLQTTFNQMLGHLKVSMDRQVNLETSALKSHFYALQSQMNPHFMHNILAIISIEAIQDGNLKTANMCSKLCHMLKFTASMGDGRCSLEDELLNAKHYLELMKDRYEDLFEFTIENDASLNQIIIPKLIIQPLCENSFKHGFKQKEAPWKIKVSTYNKNGYWYIEINDNGTGFSEEYLSYYYNSISTITTNTVDEQLQQIEIGGLCLINIYMRLRIFYDEHFVFDIQTNNTGATIIIGGALND